MQGAVSTNCWQMYKASWRGGEHKLSIFAMNWNEFERKLVIDVLHFMIMGLVFIGVFMNVWSLSILLRRDLRTQPKFLLLTSMALVDLLVCVAVLAEFWSPAEFIKHVYSTLPPLVGRVLCRVTSSDFLPCSLIATSAWHTVMISIARYASVRNKGTSIYLYSFIYPFIT